MRKIIIDTDPGIDDAVAIALAIRSKQLDVKLISTVSGNVDVEKTTSNALKLVEFFNADIPVAKGCSSPILKEFKVNAAEFHGETGMNGYDFPKPKRKVVSIHAVEALKETILSSKEKITLVPIGPLTNIAILLKMYPQVKKNIDEIVMMGGSLSGGNTTTAAEFNIYIDPHAAAIVFKSGLKITMLGLDVTMKAIIHNESSSKIKETGYVGEMLYKLFEYYRGGSLKTGLRMHDACAIAYILKPEIFETKKYYIDVVTEGPAAGTLIADLHLNQNKKNKENVNVAINIDSKLFEKWIVNEFIK